METLQWAIGILVTVNLAVTGFIASQLWAHVIKCGHASADIATLKADMERTKEDIGTHDRGMRGDLHRTTSKCQEHELKITLLERK